MWKTLSAWLRSLDFSLKIMKLCRFLSMKVMKSVLCSRKILLAASRGHNLKQGECYEAVQMQNEETPQPEQQTGGRRSKEPAGGITE